MNRIEQEIAVKNNFLGHLNRDSAKVYRYTSLATPPLDAVASEKYRRSVSGEVPSAMVPAERPPWGKRDWGLALGVAAVCLLIFYLLVKYKVITI